MLCTTHKKEASARRMMLHLAIFAIFQIAFAYFPSYMICPCIILPYDHLLCCIFVHKYILHCVLAISILHFTLILHLTFDGCRLLPLIYISTTHFHIIYILPLMFSGKVFICAYFLRNILFAYFPFVNTLIFSVLSEVNFLMSFMLLT